MQRLVYLVQYQVRRNVKYTNSVILLERSFMRRNYKTSSIKSQNVTKCFLPHREQPWYQPHQQCLTENNQPHHNSALLSQLLFWNFGVFLTQCSALAITINSLATGALLNYTPLKQFKRLLCRSLLLQVLEANWKTNRRRIGNCKVV